MRKALKEVPGAALGDDVEVRIRGRVRIYPPSGQYQLVMTGIDPVFTVGRLAANREQVLRLLSSEGLLGVNGALELAPVPLRVGLITSGGSAAYHDFTDELLRSPYAWRVVLVDVAVQSAGAPQRIKWALGRLAQLDLDVVVLALAAARVPTSRRSTPSWWRGRSPPWKCRCSRASATRSTAAWPTRSRTRPARPPPRARRSSSAGSTTSWARSITRRSGSRRGPASGWPSPTASSTRPCAAPCAARRARSCAKQSRLDRAHGRLDELARRRTVDLGAQLDSCARRVGELGRRATRDRRAVLVTRERELVTHAQHHLERASMRLGRSEAVVRALDPRRVLERGYSITRDADGRVLRTTDAVLAGALVETELASGRVTSRVESITAPEEPGD